MNVNLIEDEKDVKEKSKKKGGASNLIKINLSETGESQQPQPAQGTSTGKSKKGANGTTSVMLL